jgi:hypothetical protein
MRAAAVFVGVMIHRPGSTTRSPRHADWVMRAGHNEDNALPRCHRAVTLDQISGTRSWADNVAGTLASILSLLHANGARPLTLVASAISTSHPCSSRRSCTNARRAWCDPTGWRPHSARPRRRPA